MVLPPAGWYDDPEVPSQYRYWDGEVWTEHRAPRATPTAARDTSAVGIVTRGWNLLGEGWLTLLVIGATVFVIMLGALLAAALALASSLEPDLLEILDRITDPRWDPANDPADRAFRDSIEFDPSPAVIVFVIIAALGLNLAMGLGYATAMLFLASINAGARRPGAECFSLALRRAPRWIGIFLVWAVLFTAGFAVLALLVAVAVAVDTILVVVVVPLVVAAIIFVWPFLHLSSTTLILAPRHDPPLRRTIALVSADWGGVAGRVLVINLVLLGIALAGVILQLIPILGILAGLGISAVQYGLMIATSVALYDFAGGPLDPEVPAARTG